jgi:hypothetical protein
MITSFFPESLPVNDPIKTSFKSQSLSYAIRHRPLISMRLTMQAILAIGIIAILFTAGCADIRTTQKAKDFGTTFGASAEQQKLIEWFKANYGDPTTNNNDIPRFVLPMVTTGLTQDNMPMDNVQIFPKDGGSVYFLVVYDNFKKGDPINVKWTYLANGMGCPPGSSPGSSDCGSEVASVDQQAGGDFGRLIVEIQKPDSGWGVGKQEITVTGMPASGIPRRANVHFEIGAEKQTAPLPWEGQGPVTPAEVPSVSSRPAKATIKQPTKATGMLQRSMGPEVWAGTWDTSYGIMHLTLSGDQVTGTYEYDYGRISGTVSGTTLTGTFREGQYELHPDSTGDVILTLSKDGNSFSGKWRHDSTEDWTEDWYGTWIPDVQGVTPSAMPPSQGQIAPAGQYTWTGTWMTTWSGGQHDVPMNLVQAGNAVTGTYEYSDGTIAGTVQGDRLIGTWTQDNGGSKGPVEFVMARDGKTISGWWDYEGSNFEETKKESPTWTGIRVSG